MAVASKPIPIAGIAISAIARFLILTLAYFGSPLAPISFLPSAPITLFDVFPPSFWAWNPGFWLSPGHLILILYWPAAIISRRALGANASLMAAALAWGVIASALGLILYQLNGMFTVSPLPPLDICASFIAAMALPEIWIWRRRFVRLSDAAIPAGLYAIAFNLFILRLDPGMVGPQLVTQSLIFILGAGLISILLARMSWRRT
jgi:hypothetical protein